MDNVWKTISEYDSGLVLTLRLVSKPIHAAVMLGTGGKSILTATMSGDVASVLSATSKLLNSDDDMALVDVVWNDLLGLPIDEMGKLISNDFIMIVYITNAAAYLLLEVDRAYESVMQFVYEVWEWCAQTDNVEMMRLSFINTYNMSDDEVDELLLTCLNHGSHRMYARVRRALDLDDSELIDMMSCITHGYYVTNNEVRRACYLTMIRDIVSDRPSVQNHSEWADCWAPDLIRGDGV